MKTNYDKLIIVSNHFDYIRKQVLYMKDHIKFGLTTFVETTPLHDGKTYSHQERILQVLEEIKLADKLGLDYYGIGEHHREEYAASAPEMILSAAASITKNISLGTAVTVLSSQDPVRVYEQFATLDLISNGRAEIMAGRGSFIESFPLFGYDLKDYNELFSEKLKMILEIRKNKRITFKSNYTQHLENQLILPRSKQDLLKVSIAVGGTQESVERAATLGLPIVFAILGGPTQYFEQLISYYKKLALENGHDLKKLEVSSNFHGFIGETEKEADDLFFNSAKHIMDIIGKDRGWTAYTYPRYQAMKTSGSLLVGSPLEIAQKMADLIIKLDLDRILIQLPVGTIKHEEVLKSITRYANIVKPKVIEILKQKGHLK